MAENEFAIRQMTKDDVELAVNWAAEEGWNPARTRINRKKTRNPGNPSTRNNLAYIKIKTSHGMAGAVCAVRRTGQKRYGDP